MSRNIFDLSFLTQLVGQEETQKLEFKSSRPFHGTENERTKFFRSKIVPAVSAFLNSDGGLLVVGVEEKGGMATSLSPGVPKETMNRDQLSQIIQSRIQPSTANFISVHSVATDSEGQLFAFIVEVRPGVTAYQADDHIYYVRKSGSSEAMEDKDIRLRMLSGDKPRLNITLRCETIPSGISGFASGLRWLLTLHNSGMKTIRTASIHTRIETDGISGERIGLS